MHLTLKKEATRPLGFNSLQQQEQVDTFVHEFNTERPYEALGMKCPAELYTASTRVYAGLPTSARRVLPEQSRSRLFARLYGTRNRSDGLTRTPKSARRG